MSRTTYSKTNLCPVCGTGTKNCSCTADGLQLCRGTPGYGWKLLKETGHAGFCCYRHEDDDRRLRSNHDRKVCGLPPKAKPVKPFFDWHRYAREHVPALTADRVLELARRLGVPTAVLAKMPLLGYRTAAVYLLDGEPIDESYWSCPETDAAGNVVGLERRFRRECIEEGQSDKKAAAGCDRGLILPDGWCERPGPAVAVEGFSDLAAATAANLCAVSRPSNTGGVEHLVELFRDWPLDRDIIIVGENDEKPDGKWPGKEGAVAVATKMAEQLDRVVKWTLPPVGIKDSREYLSDTSGRWDKMPWEERGASLLAHYVANAVAIEPPAVPDEQAAEPLKTASERLKELMRGLNRCSGCNNQECGKPGTISLCEGARAWISNAEKPGIGIHARADAPDLLRIVGKAPRFRPCRYSTTKLREGCHHTTVGSFDVLKTTCGKCGACQEKIRHAEKLLHCAAALAIGTHIYHQEHEEDWKAVRAKLDRIRKKLGRKDPYPFSRCIQADGRRFVVVSIDAPAELVPAEFIPTSGKQCAERMADAIEAIPYKLPKHTTRIQSNAAWKAAGGEIKEVKKEKLYDTLGPVELKAGADLVAVAEVAEASDAVVEVVRSSLSSHRIEDRIIVKCVPEKEHEVFRLLFKGTLSQMRDEARERRDRARQRQERRAEERQRMKAWNAEAESITRDLRALYRGRESEARGLIAELIA